MPSHANKSTKVAALQLRKAGKSFPFIAKQLNCNERTLKRWVKAAGDAGTGVDAVSPEPAPRKIRFDKGVGTKISPVMIQ